MAQARHARYRDGMEWIWYILAAVVGIFIQYWLIRTAVGSAIRDSDELLKRLMREALEPSKRKGKQEPASE